ncbi:beta-galactosidase-1-like protein 2 isoform X2 [Denticeps clupeoides]|uniref:beta-galactosidase-1-like protein 2 isoform X2 n=1 Tax=Denticeps clupeoides TaxID=299321 RepID=UPI0010A4A477|nr:beta-galactosidase-1-like protein 2 isoform X2 [Denticeps clupeoides]
MSEREGLKANSGQFTLQDVPFRILGGSIHYFRVPRAYWRDRLLKMRACGINTVSTYVPWNLHEPERGLFLFKGQLDIESYINLASELGLWVILRPGPYICAEWDLGGLPSWLLRDKDMRLRTTYSGFTNAVETYFDKLIPKVAQLQFSRGGPIIAFQVENEYGSYSKDKHYMTFIKEALLSRGISELLLTSDNREGLKCGGVEGALRTINLQKLSYGTMQYLANMQPEQPLLVMEYWSGWFDVWGEPHHVFQAKEMVNVVRELLEHGASINLYMFHGGTSFGFMSGAVDFGTYKPQISSYDYDAPLSECGDYTAKYHLLRNLLKIYQKEKLPEPPLPQSRKAYETVPVSHHIPLWESLQFTETPFKSLDPINMESLPVHKGNGQSYGYTLYETTITTGGTLNSRNNIRDRALVFVNMQFVGVLDYRSQELTLPERKVEQTLSLLVENLGRVNYGDALDYQRKGLVGDIALNHIPVKGFTVYSLDMTPSFLDRLKTGKWKTVSEIPTCPGFFQGNLTVHGHARDTFVKLLGWNKGVVFVNGHLLGRYWFIGPQHVLYLPAPFLKSGNNQVTVFEEQIAGGQIQFTTSPEYGRTLNVSSHPFCNLI